MNAYHLTLLRFAVFALIGVPLAAAIDPAGHFFYLVGGQSREWIPVAYGWTLYAFGVMVLAYYAFGLRGAVRAYQDRAPVPMDRAAAQRLWAVAFAAAAVCTLVLFVQNGFTHPALAALGRGARDVAILRIETTAAINMSVYNLGLHVFAALALVMAAMVLRQIGLIVPTVALFFLLATFSLAKSPIADVVVELAFVYLLLRRPSWRVIPVLAVVLIAALGFMAWFTGWSSNLRGFGLSIGLRVVWGQISDLPHYFNLFSHERLDPVALLPPYVQSALGVSAKSAARLVMEFSNPSAVVAGTAGVANSLFIGEAYGVAGIFGVLIAPWIVVAHFVVASRVFLAVRKDVLTIFVYGYLFDRMTAALFAGISSFIFSAIHIIFGAFLAVLLVYLAVPTYRPAGMWREVPARG